MGLGELQDLLLSRGWIAAAALAGIIWRKHEARDEATASKVSALAATVATREELVRLHTRLDQQDSTTAANHRAVMDHLLQLAQSRGVPAQGRQPPPGAES